MKDSSITNLDYLRTLQTLARNDIKVTFIRYTDNKSTLLLQVKTPFQQVKAKEVLQFLFSSIEIVGISTLVLHK